MATLADSLVSSSSRPLTLRMRPDLTARRQRYHGQSYWVVKEPIGLNYYRFHEEEYAILCMMDGQSSLESIKERFEQEFTPQKITFQDLQQFVGMLHRSGLVVANAIGQGHQLRKRRDQKKRRELLGKFTNVFALRWRGIDPERILNRIYPYTGWFFRKPTVLFNLGLALVALLLITVQFDVFRSRLPSFHQFFGNWENWLVMAVVMAVAKVLHEFGHGLSCKHFGGECHEMGFMLLVFTPALYCNVSDSWMLPSKWRRAFIGAAGMYVEMVLASIATLIWWFTDRTTLLNQICLSLMFICSVSTLLFNGNPLLRFDGYYILMDLIEIPNLRQKATEVLKRFLVGLCLGIEMPDNPFLPQRNRFFFGLYTVAAVCYRWIIVFSILLFFYSILAFPELVTFCSIQPIQSGHLQQLEYQFRPEVEVTVSEKPENYCEMGDMVCDIFAKIGKTCKAGLKNQECPQKKAKKGKAAKKAKGPAVRTLIGVDMPFDYEEVEALTGPEYARNVGFDERAVPPYETLKANVSQMMKEKGEAKEAEILEFPRRAAEGNVLVIDDEPNIANNVKRILTRKGYPVDQAVNKEEALSKIGEKTYELVLLDLKIPGVQGMELLRAIKDKRPETKVIIITGYASIESAKESARLGIVDYLHKPFTPDEIRNAAENALTAAA